MHRFISRHAQVLRVYSDRIGKTPVIYAAAFLVALAVALNNLGMVFFTRDVHRATAGQIGLIAGCGSVSYALGCLLVQPFFAGALPRHKLVAATLGAGLAGLGMLVAPTVLLLCAAMFASGISLSFFWPPLMGWLSAGSEGQRLNRLIGGFNVAWSAGIVLGPYLCGRMSEHDPRAPLEVAAVLHAATAAIVIVASAVLPRIRREQQAPAERVDAGPTAPRTRMRFAAWIGLVVTFAAVGVVVTVFPVAARDRLALSPTAIGTALLVRALTNAAGFYVLSRTSLWHFRLRPMLMGQAASAAILAGLALTESYTLTVALIGFFGLTGSLAYVESVFHGVSGSADRALHMAIHEALLALGAMAGAAAGGAIYQRTSLATVYWLCAGLLIAAMPVQVLLRGPAEGHLRGEGSGVLE